MEGLSVAKLVSGEFVIGRSLPNGMLVNVFKINIVFDQISGQPNLQMLPYMFPINSNLDYFIGMDKVICMSTPGEKLQELYVQQITKILQEQNQQAQSAQQQVAQEEAAKAEEILNNPDLLVPNEEKKETKPSKKGSKK